MFRGNVKRMDMFLSVRLTQILSVGITVNELVKMVSMFFLYWVIVMMEHHQIKFWWQVVM